jgi:hypothetical protein
VTWNDGLYTFSIVTAYWKGLTMHIYLPKEDWIPGEFAAMLAIGDSWFWYPKNNILQALVEHPRQGPLQKHPDARVQRSEA